MKTRKENLQLNTRIKTKTIHFYRKKTTNTPNRIQNRKNRALALAMDPEPEERLGTNPSPIKSLNPNPMTNLSKKKRRKSTILSE